MVKKDSDLGKGINAITTVFDCAYRVMLELSRYVLLVLVLIVSTQVICRKFLGFSIRWSEEVALLLMVWVAFEAMAIGVEKDLHISIVVFFNKFPKSFQKFCIFLNNLITCVFGIFLITDGTKLVQSTKNSTLAATQWPAATMYIMIPVSGVFIVYFTMLKLLNLEDYRHKNIEEGRDE